MMRLRRHAGSESRVLSRGNMPFDAKAIANGFLNRATAGKRKLTALQIQKLVYFAQGYYLAAYGSPLINENIEAWQYGPVVPSLYHAFKRFGGDPITELATGGAGLFDMMPVPPPAGDIRIDSVMDYVWKTYGVYSGGQLSEMTHRPGTPWFDANAQNKYGLKNVCIPINSIEEHFKPFIKKKTQ